MAEVKPMIKNALIYRAIQENQDFAESTSLSGSTMGEAELIAESILPAYCNTYVPELESDKLSMQLCEVRA